MFKLEFGTIQTGLSVNCQLFLHRARAKIKLFFSPVGFYLVSAEDIAGVYFALYIIQGTIIAVRDDDVRTTLKLSQVVHHTTSEEGASSSKVGS